MGLNPSEIADITHPRIRRIEFPDQATYDRILNKMVITFLGRRKGCETERSTEKYCRSVLDVCSSGFRPDGSVWKKAPGLPNDDWYEVLRKRLRTYKYDIDNKSMIPGNTKKTSVRLQEKFGLKKTDSSNKDAGDHPTGFRGGSQTLSTSEKVRMNEFKEAFLEDFPIKSSVVDTLMMNRLAFMYIMNERDYDNIEITKFLTEEIVKLSDALGVSGKQRVTQEDKDREGTIDELISIFKKTKEEFIDVEVEYQKEELSLISNAIHRGSLPEFLGMSYVKTIFGDTVEGKKLSIKNVDEWLKSQGITVNADQTQQG